MKYLAAASYFGLRNYRYIQFFFWGGGETSEAIEVLKVEEIAIHGWLYVGL